MGGATRGTKWLADYGRQIDNGARTRRPFSGEVTPRSPWRDCRRGPLGLHFVTNEEAAAGSSGLSPIIAAGSGPGRRAAEDAAPRRALATSLIDPRGAVSEIGEAGQGSRLREPGIHAEYQLRSLWGLYSFCIAGEQHRVA